MAKPALGKGLGALINHRVAAPCTRSRSSASAFKRCPWTRLRPSPLQPRAGISEASTLQELVESIRERGIIQPLIVQQGSTTNARAHRGRTPVARARVNFGSAEAPAIIRQASDREVLELALIENLQREDLNPIEEAGATARLHRDFGLTQDEISKRVGKSRASVANAMRLLDLEPDAQTLLKQGRISVGHAKVLLPSNLMKSKRLLMDLIVRQGASVRVAEKLAAQQLARAGKSCRRRSPADRSRAFRPLSKGCRIS